MKLIHISLAALSLFAASQSFAVSKTCPTGNTRCVYVDPGIGSLQGQLAIAWAENPAGGIEVTDILNPTGFGKRLGLEVGDIIQSVGGNPVNSTAEFSTVVFDAQSVPGATKFVVLDHRTGNTINLYGYII